MCKKNNYIELWPYDRLKEIIMIDPDNNNDRNYWIPTGLNLLTVIDNCIHIRKWISRSCVADMLVTFE